MDKGAHKWPLIRHYIKRYRRCITAADVSAMQETIIKELEEDYERSRVEKGESARL